MGNHLMKYLIIILKIVLNNTNITNTIVVENKENTSNIDNTYNTN